MKRFQYSLHSITPVSRAVVAFGLIVLVAAVCQPAQSQTYTVLHTFTGGGDGYQPYSTLILDNGGNLYGTTSEVGHGNGTIFQLKRSGSNWLLNTLYSFSGPDGSIPYGGVTLGPDGALYGATAQGGYENFGTVYRLTPQASLCKSVSCPWELTMVHHFVSADANRPYFVVPFFDAAGNMYGTTEYGGINGEGAVFKIVRSGGSWDEAVIHSMNDFTEGAAPTSGLIADSAGNLYGVVQASPGGFGAVYQLNASTGWTLSILHNFTSSRDGVKPVGALAMDAAGNLYGTASDGGTGQAGTVFELSPSGNGWTFNVIYSFTGPQNGGPEGPLAIDANGNLYGTTVALGANGYGTVFKLTHTQSGWTYSSLHDFDRSDGAGPYGGVIFDASGNIYGTAAYGGQTGGNCSGPGGLGCGVVFEITQ